MRTFSDRALSIQPTGVRKMFDLAGDDTISFGLGEPDFQPPKVAIDAFHQAMLDGHNKYTTTAGLPALREQIAQSWNFFLYKPITKQRSQSSLTSCNPTKINFTVRAFIFM